MTEQRRYKDNVVLAKDPLRKSDTASMGLADDLVTIDHYRIRLRTDDGKQREITVGEANPYCDDLVSDDIAKYQTPEEAESARDEFVSANRAIGLPTDAAVVGVSSAGVVLAVDGEPVLLPNDNDDGDDLPF
jgi:hypothetical protein